MQIREDLKHFIIRINREIHLDTGLTIEMRQQLLQRIGRGARQDQHVQRFTLLRNVGHGLNVESKATAIQYQLIGQCCQSADISGNFQAQPGVIHLIVVLIGYHGGFVIAELPDRRAGGCATQIGRLRQATGFSLS